MVHPKRLLLGLALLGALSTSCQSTKHSDDMMRITAHGKEWFEAYRQRDYDAIADLHAPYARLFAPHTPAVNGVDAIRETWLMLVEQFGMDGTWGPDEIVVSRSGDMAYVTGTFDLTWATPEGKVEDRGKYLEVWRKFDGEWKVCVDMFNSDLPMP